MKKFLGTIENLQSVYRKLIFLKLNGAVEGCTEVEYNEQKAKIIEDMKPIAKVLVEEYELDEFDFSDNEKFLLSVKKFLSRKD